MGRVPHAVGTPIVQCILHDALYGASGRGESAFGRGRLSTPSPSANPVGIERNQESHRHRDQSPGGGRSESSLLPADQIPELLPTYPVGLRTLLTANHPSPWRQACGTSARQCCICRGGMHSTEMPRELPIAFARPNRVWPRLATRGNRTDMSRGRVKDCFFYVQ
jgi:hypothetical protein